MKADKNTNTPVTMEELRAEIVIGAEAEKHPTIWKKLYKRLKEIYRKYTLVRGFVRHQARLLLVRLRVLPPKKPNTSMLGSFDPYGEEMFRAVSAKTIINDPIPQETLAVFAAISQETAQLSEGIINENCN